jgi:hypothetical protein
MSQTADEGRRGRESLAVLEASQLGERFRRRLLSPSPSPPQVGPAAPSDRLYHIILLALCSFVLLMAAFLSVKERSRVIVPVVQLAVPELCTMRRLMGIDCPGCGLTRCFISLAHGDLVAAWSYNPAGLWLFAIVAFQIPFRGFQLWRISRGLPEMVLPWALQITFGILAIGLIVQWALRLSGITF